MPLIDTLGLCFFLIIWFFYEPLLPRLTGGRRSINDRMIAIRQAWMTALVRREVRITDSQFLGHTINSASFFGSANMIAIAALAGFMFSGDANIKGLTQFGFLDSGPIWMLGTKVALMLLTLARGMLDFVWAIRQLNYCLAAIGSIPDPLSDAQRNAWAKGLSAMLSPALRTFSRGVRSYYFALAASGWFFGPLALVGTTIFATILLAWRQTRSPAAQAVEDVYGLVNDINDPQQR